MRNACGHNDPSHPVALCPHLWVCDADQPYLVWYTGEGLQVDYLCPKCVRRRESGTPTPASPVCQACFQDGVGTHGELDGVRGQPEILTRPLDLPSVETVAMSVDAKVGAVGRVCSDRIFVYTEDQWIASIDLATQRTTLLVQVALPPEDSVRSWSGHHQAPALHVSPDGRFAAVVRDFGRLGAVVDLQTRQITMRLDAGTHKPHAVPFSIAFVDVVGEARVIHRTAWNRLDISDPRTGRLLTTREIAEGFDYFHGRIVPSPGGDHMLDDGWVWHPYGVISTWSLRRWLEDATESESGESRTTYTRRGYYWNHGCCWLDDEHFAIEGLGTDDDGMRPGVRIFRAANRAEVRSFAGPRGTLFADRGLLFASGRDGLTVWELASGCRLGTVPGFVPTLHIPDRQTLVALSDKGLQRWSYATIEAG